MGKRKMGSNVWYLTENDRKNSSYTDFTYTDFTQASNDRPVSRRTGNNPPSGKVHVQKGRAQRFSAQKIPAQKILLVDYFEREITEDEPSYFEAVLYS